jgi:DNA-binding transcriptional MerR regulator
MTHDEILKRLEGCRLPEWDELPDFGLYMDQLVTYVARTFPGISGRLDLTSSMINNYVKAGLIDKPTGKKYSREALAQLLMISLMKVSTPLDVMNKILHPESGTETKEMYSSFVATQRRVKNEIIAKGNIPALDYALESASLQLALRLLTD